MEQVPVIGVIGGMGPYAGLDLVEKIFDQTAASRDHEHVPVALLSYPRRIVDRTPFLFGETEENPAEAIAAIALQLASVGATVAAIPCNTAHAPPIYDRVQALLAEHGSPLRLFHLIEETVRALADAPEGYRRVGVLGTSAVSRLGVYRNALRAAGLEPVEPDENVQENIVNRTIFDATYGLKAQSKPVSKIARQSLLNAVDHLREKGAEVVVLGCTELPLAIPEDEVEGLPMIDPAVVLARALLAATYPEMLRSR